VAPQGTRVPQRCPSPLGFSVGPSKGSPELPLTSKSVHGAPSSRLGRELWSQSMTSEWAPWGPVPQPRQTQGLTPGRRHSMVGARAPWGSSDRGAPPTRGTPPMADNPHQAAHSQGHAPHPCEPSQLPPSSQCWQPLPTAPENCRPRLSASSGPSNSTCVVRSPPFGPSEPMGLPQNNPSEPMCQNILH